jgi:hypothetical protein
VLGAQIVAEAVGRRLHHREALGVGPVLRRIAAAALERHGDVEAGVTRRLADRRRAGEHDRIGHRQLAAQLVDLREHAGQFLRLVDVPAALRLEADARTVGAAAMVRLR